MALTPLLVGLVLAAVPAVAQDTPITGARISLAPREVPVQRITLENRRDHALVAFQIGLFRPGEAVPSITYWADYTFGGAVASTRGAIAARATGTIEVDVSDQPEIASAALLVAQFDDGHCEGREPAANSGFRLRMPCKKPPGTIAGVRLTAERTVGSRHVVLVENLSTVPIEALGFEITTPAARGASGQTVDYVTLPRDEPSLHGRIQPAEMREFPTGSARALPPEAEARLTFVLFDDLRFQGLHRERDELLRSRERQADALAFAMAALREAAAMPSADIVGFLERKRAEWLAQPRPAGDPPAHATALREGIDLARSEPGAFPAMVKGYIETLETQHQQLLRHRRATSTR